MSTNANTHGRVMTPARWPAPPTEMSVSTHLEIEECPRRWALSAAEYPELWGGRGYPPKLQVAALTGSVVHLALEIITKRLLRAGVPSLSDPSAPEVLRALGGYTRVVEECVDRILERYADNPRASALMEHAQRTLRGQVPTLRVRVQSMLSRLRLPKGAAVPPASWQSKASGPSRRFPLANGAYPEVEVRARSIGWKGKVDLLVLNDDACEITDFKTGEADEAHKFQVRAYAVMWRLDNELNPSERPADRLVLKYEAKDVDVAPPSASEVDDLTRELLARRQAAEAALAAQPPSARPSTESCRYCGVRQLCDVYWTGFTPVASDGDCRGDVELIVTGRHGPSSFDADIVRAPARCAATIAVLRVTVSDEFAPGTRLRVLDCSLSRDPDVADAPLNVGVGLYSECFEV